MLDDLTEHLPRLRRYARALLRNVSDADDLVQDTVERAWTRRRLFKPGTRCDHWLLTIMHNLYANQVRQRATRPAEIPFDGDLPLAAPGSPGSGLELRDLDAALARLPDDQRTVLLLVALEECSYQDAAQILGVPVGTVMSRLSRGRDRLRQLMTPAAPAAGATGSPVGAPQLRVVR